MITSSDRPDTPTGQRPVVATACGKLILLGEHAVVYGEPALAVPLVTLRLSVVLSTGSESFGGFDSDEDSGTQSGDLSYDDLKETAVFPIYRAGTLDEEATEEAESESGLIESRTIDLGGPPPLRIDVGEGAPPNSESDISRALGVAAKMLGLPVPLPLRVAVRSGGLRSGMGTSAALGVALSRALLCFYGRTVDERLVLQGAEAVERLFHGNPSGVDHTVAAGERPVWFLKGKPPQQLVRMPALDLVILPRTSGQPTSEVVEGVRERLASDPSIARVIAAIGRWTRDGRSAWARGDLNGLAQAMTAQQAELDRLGVVVAADREAIATALDAGALSAKITGAGSGGSLFALVDTESAPRVAAAWGPSALRTPIGPH